MFRLGQPCFPSTSLCRGFANKKIGRGVGVLTWVWARCGRLDVGVCAAKAEPVFVEVWQKFGCVEPR